MKWLLSFIVCMILMACKQIKNNEENNSDKVDSVFSSNNISNDSGDQENNISNKTGSALSANDISKNLSDREKDSIEIHEGLHHIDSMRLTPKLLAGADKIEYYASNGTVSPEYQHSQTITITDKEATIQISGVGNKNSGWGRKVWYEEHFRYTKEQFYELRNSFIGVIAEKSFSLHHQRYMPGSGANGFRIFKKGKVIFDADKFDRITGDFIHGYELVPQTIQEKIAAAMDYFELVAREPLEIKPWSRDPESFAGLRFIQNGKTMFFCDERRGVIRLNNKTFRLNKCTFNDAKGEYQLFGENVQITVPNVKLKEDKNIHCRVGNISQVKVTFTAVQKSVTLKVNNFNVEDCRQPVEEQIKR